MTGLKPLEDNMSTGLEDLFGSIYPDLDTEEEEVEDPYEENEPDQSQE